MYGFFSFNFLMMKCSLDGNGVCKPNTVKVKHLYCLNPPETRSSAGDSLSPLFIISAFSFLSSAIKRDSFGAGSSLIRVYHLLYSSFIHRGSITAHARVVSVPFRIELDTFKGTDPQAQVLSSDHQACHHCLLKSLNHKQGCLDKVVNSMMRDLPIPETQQTIYKVLII